MNSVHLKSETIILLSRIGVISKNRIIDASALEEIVADKGSVFARFSSSGNLFELKVKGEKYFFRPCFERQDDAKFLKRLLFFYERYIDKSGVQGIREQLANRRNANRFLVMGIPNDSSSRLYLYLKEKNPCSIGLNKHCLDQMGQARLDQFVHYAWSEIVSHRLNANGGNYQLFSYNRCKCQEEMYNLLGVGRLICPVKLVRLRGIDGEMIVGSLMPEAKGVSPLVHGKTNMEIVSPALQGELDIMNVMDAICYERDHRPGNYNIVVSNDGHGVSVQAFDNDSSLTFAPVVHVDCSFGGCSPVVGSNGKFNIPGMDNEFKERLLGLSEAEVRGSVASYLNRLQAISLIHRISSIKKSILKGENGRNGGGHFLLFSALRMGREPQRQSLAPTRSDPIGSSRFVNLKRINRSLHNGNSS